MKTKNINVNNNQQKDQNQKAVYTSYNSLTQNEIWRCQKQGHQNDVFNAFCLYSSCPMKGFICNNCLGQYHKNHIKFCLSIQDIIQQCKVYKDAKFPPIEQELIDQYNEKIQQSYDNLIANLQESKSQIMHEIVALYDSMESILNEQMEEIIQITNSFLLCQNFSQIIQKLDSKHYKHDINTKSIIQYLTTLLEFQKPGNNLVFSPVNSHLKNIQKLKELAALEQFNDIIFQTNKQLIEQIQHKITQINEVIINNPDNFIQQDEQHIKTMLLPIADNTNLQLQISQPRFQKTEFCDIMHYLDVHAISFKAINEVYLAGFYQYQIAQGSEIKKAQFEVRIIDGRKITGANLYKEDIILTFDETRQPQLQNINGKSQFLQQILFKNAIRLKENRVYTLVLINKTQECLELGESNKEIKLYYGSKPKQEGVLFQYFNTDFYDLELAIKDGDFSAKKCNTDINQGQISNLIYIELVDALEMITGERPGRSQGGCEGCNIF